MGRGEGRRGEGERKLGERGEEEKKKTGVERREEDICC